MNIYPKTSILKVIFLVIVLFMGACKNIRKTPVIIDPISVESNFHYDKLGKILLDCYVSDSIPVPLMFDTGGKGHILFAKSFADSVLNYKDLPTEKRHIGNGWNAYIDYPVTVVKDSISIFINNKEISFPEYQIMGDELFNFTDGAKGLISIPKGDDRIWEINYEHKYVDILDSYIPTNHDIIFDIENRGNTYIILNFPFEFKRNDTTLICLEDLSLDTGKGTGGDITFQLIEPSESFRMALSDSSVLKFVQDNPFHQETDIESRWYYLNIGGIIDDNIWVVHAHRELSYSLFGEIRKAVVGNNFLKRYNIRMDLSEMKVYLTPIDFIHIRDEIGNNMALLRNKMGLSGILKYMNDKFFLSQGEFEIGDIFETIDGQAPFDIPKDYYNNKKSGDTVTVVFNRKGEQMTKKVIKP